MEYEILYIFLVSGVITWCGLLTRYCYKAKCSYIKLGCLEIRRDVAGEEKADEESRRNHGSGSSYNNNNTQTTPNIIML